MTIDIDHENCETCVRVHVRNVLGLPGLIQRIKVEHGKKEGGGSARNGEGTGKMSSYMRSEY